MSLYYFIVSLSSNDKKGFLVAHHSLFKKSSSKVEEVARQCEQHQLVALRSEYIDYAVTHRSGNVIPKFIIVCTSLQDILHAAPRSTTQHHAAPRSITQHHSITSTIWMQSRTTQHIPATLLTQYAIRSQYHNKTNHNTMFKSFHLYSGH